MCPTIQATGLPKSYSSRTFVASFKADPELWSRFKGVCAERGVSICYVLEGLMEAWIQAQRVQATLIQPVHIDLTMQHIVQRPRRIQRLEDVVIDARAKTWPPSCEYADEFWKGPRMVGCTKEKDFLPLVACWRCYYNRIQGSE